MEENIVIESIAAANDHVSGLMEWLIINQGLITEYSVNIVTAIVILFVGNWVTKKIAGAVANVLEKRNLDHAVVSFIENLVRYLMLATVLIAALGRVGVQTASIVAVIGAAGLAIGLALQGSLANFSAGILIVTFRPFRSGDYVEVAGIAGSVTAIEIFSTELVTPDNKMIVVPNGSILSNPIINYSRHKTRRIDYVISVAYHSDLKQTKQILTNIVNAEPRVLKDPAPVIGVGELTDSAINFIVRPWVKTEDYWGVYSDLLQAIKEGLDKEGIGIPFRQIDVHYSIKEPQDKIGIKDNKLPS